LDEWAFLPGKKNDLKIFRLSFMTWLEPFERVEADAGYEGEAPRKVKCPSSIGILEEKHRMLGIVRRRQSTVNRRFKQWSILKQVFCHDLACMAGFLQPLLLLASLLLRMASLCFM
jgi:hypothetical protein